MVRCPGVAGIAVGSSAMASQAACQRLLDLAAIVGIGRFGRIDQRTTLHNVAAVKQALAGLISRLRGGPNDCEWVGCDRG